jgi:hypothetical protein
VGRQMPPTQQQRCAQTLPLVTASGKQHSATPPPPFARALALSGLIHVRHPIWIGLSGICLKSFGHGTIPDGIAPSLTLRSQSSAAKRKLGSRSRSQGKFGVLTLSRRGVGHVRRNTLIGINRKENARPPPVRFQLGLLPHREGSDREYGGDRRHPGRL